RLGEMHFACMYAHQFVRYILVFFFFSSRRRHTRCYRDWSSDVCSSDLFRRLTRLDAGLRGTEPRDRDHERRARHVRHAHLVTELDRRGLATVLTADADLEVGPRTATTLDADLDELSDAVLIEDGEGVERQQPLLKIF